VLCLRTLHLLEQWQITDCCLGVIARNIIAPKFCLHFCGISVKWCAFQFHENNCQKDIEREDASVLKPIVIANNTLSLLNFFSQLCVIIKEKDEFICLNENTFSPKYIPLKTDDTRKIEHTKLLLKIFLVSLILHIYRLLLSKSVFRKDCRQTYR